MSPEVAAGERATAASDVFSLGSTLYAAVTGSPPFGTSGPPRAIMRRVQACAIVMPPTAGPLRDVLERMLQKDPTARPTARQAAQLLREVATGVAPRPVDDGTTGRLRWAVVAASGLVLVAAAATAARLSFSGEPTPDTSTLVAAPSVPAPPAAGPQGVTPPVAGPVLRMLQKDPAARPTARQAAQLLRDVADEAPPPVPPRWHGLSARLAGRRRVRLGSWFAGALVGGGVVVAVVLAVIVFRLPGGPDGSDAAVLPAPTGPPPGSGLLGDVRTAEPCALADLAVLRPYGETQLEPDWGSFERCDVFVEPAPGNRVDGRRVATRATS